MKLKFTVRVKRALIAGGTVMSGFLMASFLFPRFGLTPPLAILAITLAAAVGTGKLASP